LSSDSSPGKICFEGTTDQLCSSAKWFLSEHTVYNDAVVGHSSAKIEPSFPPESVKINFQTIFNCNLALYCIV